MARYLIVTSKTLKHLHMKIGDDKVEGMTRCGKYVSKGWLWVTGKLTKKQFAKPRCPRCFS